MGRYRELERWIVAGRYRPDYPYDAQDEAIEWLRLCREEGRKDFVTEAFVLMAEKSLDKFRKNEILAVLSSFGRLLIQFAIDKGEAKVTPAEFQMMLNHIRGNALDENI